MCVSADVPSLDTLITAFFLFPSQLQLLNILDSLTSRLEAAETEAISSDNLALCWSDAIDRDLVAAGQGQCNESCVLHCLVVSV